MRTYPITLLLITLLALTGCQTDYGDEEGTEPDAAAEAMDAPMNTAPSATEATSLYDLVVMDDRFDTLERIVDRLDLRATLAAEDASLTIFAPTDEAFDTIQQVTLGSLLEEDNDELLRAILMAHVVDGTLTSQDLAMREGLIALEGEELDVEQDGQTIRIRRAAVTEANIEASNGVIHVIDAVILPVERSLDAGDAM